MNYTAIDIGGTFIKYARMNEYAEFLEKGKTATPYDPALFFQAIKEILSNYPGSQGICISCPGLIDVETGDVFHGGSLHFLHGRNLKREIGAFCGLPVEIENDAKCAGLAEAVLGNASGVQDSIVVVLGTGIGGALIKDKRVLHGKHLMAGEFSWIIPDLDRSYVCDPAKHALLFREVSVKALLEKVSVLKGIPVSGISGEKVYQWAAGGDEDCRRVIQEFYRILAVQLANLQHIFDPEVICIGGGISREPGLLGSIQSAVDGVYREYGLKMAKPSLKLCKFLNDSNLIGALCHFLQRNPIKKETAV